VSTHQPRGPHLMALPCVPTSLRSRHFETSDVESDPSQPMNPECTIGDGVPDPMVLLRPRSNGDSSSRSSCLHNLEHPMFGLSPYELPSLRDLSISATCSPQMDGSWSSRLFIVHEVEGLPLLSSDARVPDVGNLTTRVRSQTNSLDQNLSNLGFHVLSDSPHVLDIPDIPSADILMLFGTFASMFMKT
jgi:hypothetical protein